MNYTEEITTSIVEQYLAQPTRLTVERLAEEHGKSIKSIIGKLSREGVYRREIYRTKRGETPITKLEIVANICEHLGLEEMVGLEKAPKNALQQLEKAILDA